MKILITGATGFVGSNLARRLIDDGHFVIGVVREGEQPFPGRIQSVLDSYDPLPEWSVLENIDAVLHQAADNDPQSKDLAGMYKANVLGTAMLFEDLYRRGVRRYVYASSTAVYGPSPSPYKENQTPVNPLTPYAYSKAAMEQYVQAFQKLHPDAHCIGLRYCNVYGPGESHKGNRASMIHQIMKAMLEEKSPKLFKHGMQMRDWVHVQDVVQANVLALEAADFGSPVVNIGSGSSTSFLDLVKIINQVLGSCIDPEWIDNPYEKTYQSHTQCDITLAEAVLGFKPQLDIHTGLRQYASNWA